MSSELLIIGSATAYCTIQISSYFFRRPPIIHNQMERIDKLRCKLAAWKDSVIDNIPRWNKFVEIIEGVALTVLFFSVVYHIGLLVPLLVGISILSTIQIIRENGLRCEDMQHHLGCLRFAVSLCIKN